MLSTLNSHCNNQFRTMVFPSIYFLNNTHCLAFPSCDTNDWTSKNFMLDIHGFFFLTPLLKAKKFWKPVPCSNYYTSLIIIREIIIQIWISWKQTNKQWKVEEHLPCPPSLALSTRHILRLNHKLKEGLLTVHTAQFKCRILLFIGRVTKNTALFSPYMDAALGLNHSIATSEIFI